MNIYLTPNAESANSFTDVRAYVYGISWTALNRHYIGYRAANKTAPELDLWSEYFTSSEYVEEFRKEHGEPDRIVVIDTFDCAEHALKHEEELQ
jgi:hypothetical protein